MSAGGWAPRRFWTEARAEAVEGGHTVRLDGRPVKTPAKAPLVLPSRALAEAVAAEWDAQQEVVDPRRMPVTRSANAALDKVTPQFDEVADLIAAYGDSDLLCYRATDPAELVARQADAWDPWLSWAREHYGARLSATAGVIHVAQPADSLERLAAGIRSLSAFELTALHDLVSLSGSLVLGLAVAEAALDPERGWRLSRIDEDWQIEQWGVDEDAAEAAEAKRAEFLHAHRFLALCRAPDGPVCD